MPSLERLTRLGRHPQVSSGILACKAERQRL
jgi:hypothetical protein